MSKRLNILYKNTFYKDGQAQSDSRCGYNDSEARKYWLILPDFDIIISTMRNILFKFNFFYRCFSLFLLAFLFTYFNGAILLAQENNKEKAQQFVEIADEILYGTNAIIQARDQYVQAAELDSTNLKANYMAGTLFLQTINKERANRFLLRVYRLNPDYKFDLFYKIGQSFQFGLEFDKALKFYNDYHNKLINTKSLRDKEVVKQDEIERRIYECNNAIEFMANPSQFSIINVGNEINSESHDFAPVLNEDETVMIFTSRRREDNLNPDVDSDNFAYEDIFMSKKVNGKWSKAQNIGDVINTKYHDSNLALSADGNYLYIYKDENNGDIYESELLENGTWSKPLPLDRSINSIGYGERSISLSRDGNMIFFSSDRPGGYGGIDIYYSVKSENGKWSKSKNLGPMVNTKYDDDSPFIDFNGRSLYFSSKGHKGMGGFDIFRTEYDSAAGDWMEPINLGYPINTPDNDIYFVSTNNGNRGYYASVREDGMGYTDIYMVTIPEYQGERVDALEKKKNGGSLDDAELNVSIDKVAEDEMNQVNTILDADSDELGTEQQKVEQRYPVRLLVKVEDNKTGKPMEANVKLVSVDDRVTIPNQYIGRGLYVFIVNMDKQLDYMLSAEKNGYMFKNFKINIPSASNKQMEISRTIELNSLESGFQTVLRNIYFDFDKASFRIDSYNELNKLERIMAENPGMVIEIAGHTDNIGGKDYNLNLSKKRAKAVVEYLTNKGIDARILKSKGYGENKPMASNDDEKDGRELNRRVEFRILDKN